MSVTEGHIDVGTTSVQLDTTLVTQSTSLEGGSRAVHREAVFLGDPVIAGARAHLEPFLLGATTRYASPVTGVELRSLLDLIGQLLDEQRLTNIHMSRLTGEELAIDDIEDY